MSWLEYLTNSVANAGKDWWQSASNLVSQWSTSSTVKKVQQFAGTSPSIRVAQVIGEPISDYFSSKTTGLNSREMVKTLTGNAQPGITLPQDIFQNWFKEPVFDANMFVDTLPEVGVSASPIEASANNKSFELPLWGKVGIIAAVVIGTVLIVKESFDD